MSLRRHNLAVVVHHVAGNGMATIADIASGTGLTLPAVTRLVDELERRRLVTTAGPVAADVCPPAENRGADYFLDTSSVVGLGVEIGPRHLSVLAADLHGAVRYRKKQVGTGACEPDAVVDRLCAMIRAACRALTDEGHWIAGVTVAVPGRVGRHGTVVVESPELGWTGVALRSMLEDSLGATPSGEAPPGAGALGIRLENTANLGALADLRDGAARELSDFIYISTGGTISAGFVSDGRLFTGARGCAGEIGHLTVAPGGPLCRCGGRGCLDAMVGGNALLRRFDFSQDFTVEGVAERASRGDEAVLKTLDAVGGDLGVGLSFVSNVLGPQAVVLGGYFAVLAPWIDDAISRELGARVVAARRVPPPVFASHWPYDAAVRGAAISVIHEVIADPTVAPERVTTPA